MIWRQSRLKSPSGPEPHRELLPRVSIAVCAQESRISSDSKGMVVAADTEDVGVEQDSSMSYEVHRRAYTPALGYSKSLLVIGEVSYPSYPDRTSFMAYGINKNGALVDFPGLCIEDPNELPGTLYDGQILITGRNFGCIFYDQQIRFDLRSCSFIMLPEDSGYEARSDVQKAVFEAN